MSLTFCKYEAYEQLTCRIVDGVPSEIDHYGMPSPSSLFLSVSLISSEGLELAQLADLPSDVLVEASRVANRLTELEANRKEDSESSRIALRRKAMLRVSGVPRSLLADEDNCVFRALQLKSQLIQCLEYSNLPDQELLTYIGRFQKDITEILRSGLL